MTLGSINHILLSHWSDLYGKLKGVSPNQEIDGNSLDLATIIAIAR